MSQVASVPELLRRGADAPAHLSLVDAVMGEDWARLRLGRGGVAREPGAIGRGSRRRDAIAGALAPSPQALVKLIGAGGAKNARGLGAQMTYLSRTGDVPLRSSESTFGVEISAEEAGRLAADWGMPETDRGGADRTSHFVVSFPRGTDPAAAERAGRAWAAELFDSGAFGERWDYYTAFHTDTAYPHIHVVVSRRGLDEGQWLRISSWSPITFERLREVQVEVAAREGIALGGTSRLSRGVHDRPVPDGEYRRARAEGRAAVAPEHSALSAIATAAEILGHARAYQGAAASLTEGDADRAGRLAAAATTLLEGRALTAECYALTDMTAKEAQDMARSIEAKQDAARENFSRLDETVGEVPDAATRCAFIRRIAALKAEAAPLLREDHRLQSYGAEAVHPDYRGFEPDPRDPAAVIARAEADDKVARLAERFDLDPAASVARYAAERVSLGLGRDYRRQEIIERQERRAALGKPEERPEEANGRILAFQAQARAIYRDAAERARDHAEEVARDQPPVTREADTGQGRHRDEPVQAREDGAGRPETSSPSHEASPANQPARSVRSRDADDDERSR
jgi:type IV secretion system T-DNA border endonuclease VirD2